MQAAESQMGIRSLADRHTAIVLAGVIDLHLRTRQSHVVTGGDVVGTDRDIGPEMGHRPSHSAARGWLAALAALR